MYTITNNPSHHIMLRLRKLFMIVFLLCAGLPVLAAGTDTVKHNALDITLGAGWGYYFNDMNTVPSDAIHNNKPAFSMRVMWVPNYRLQLGVALGYYPMFSTDAVVDVETGVRTNIKTTRTAVPFFLVASMRIIDYFYLSVGAGPSFLHYTVDDYINNSQASGSQWSGANFLLAAGYKYPLNERLRIGGEIEYTRFGKTEDDHLTIQATVAYRLFKW